jgi:ATP-GRASP peptide maturase of grasp-with-spasm system
MILIIADENDISSNLIVDWLRYFNEEIVRIDSNSKVKFVSIILKEKCDDFVLEINNKIYCLKDFKSCFIRRAKLVFDFQIPASLNQNLNYYIKYHFTNDQKDLVDYFYFLISKYIPCIGSANKNRLNKIITLRTAKDVGLKIPDTIVSGANILNSKTSWIAKGISESIDIPSTENDYGFTCYVRENQTILPEIFWPTLFQKKINKAFELRIFFVFNELYTTSIFSQLNKKTKTDFRDSNGINLPMTPYNLPDEIRLKIIKLIKKLNLNIGCIDIIVSKEGEYYFLEINPMGQFGFYGDSVNFFLEKQIATKLKNGRF